MLSKINILGFLSTLNKDLFFKTTTDKVDRNIVIKLFNNFSNKITKITIVVLDNASMHRSKKFKKNIDNCMLR